MKLFKAITSLLLCITCLTLIPSELSPKKQATEVETKTDADKQTQLTQEQVDILYDAFPSGREISFFEHRIHAHATNQEMEELRNRRTLALENFKKKLATMPLHLAQRIADFRYGKEKRKVVAQDLHALLPAVITDTRNSLNIKLALIKKKMIEEDFDLCLCSPEHDTFMKMEDVHHEFLYKQVRFGKLMPKSGKNCFVLRKTPEGKFIVWLHQDHIELLVQAGINDIHFTRQFNKIANSTVEQNWHVMPPRYDLLGFSILKLRKSAFHPLENPSEQQVSGRVIFAPFRLNDLVLRNLKTNYYPPNERLNGRMILGAM